jgi:hypothetical protein
MRQLLIIIFLIGVFIGKSENQIVYTKDLEDWEEDGKNLCPNGIKVPDLYKIF